jgi:hypothetical protein
MSRTGAAGVAGNVISAQYYGLNTRVPRSARHDDASLGADDSPVGGPCVAVSAPAFAASPERECAGAATPPARTEPVPRVVRLAPRTSASAAYHARVRCYHYANVQYQFRRSISVSCTGRAKLNDPVTGFLSSALAQGVAAKYEFPIFSQNREQIVGRYHDLRPRYRVVSRSDGGAALRRRPA